MEIKEGDHIIARVDDDPNGFVGLIHGIVDQYIGKKGGIHNYTTLMTVEIRDSVGVMLPRIHKIKLAEGFMLLRYAPNSNLRFICFYNDEAWEKMMKWEEEYPNGTKELDELRDKEKQGVLTPKEKRRLDFLDRALLREYDRCKIHFRLNRNFMREEVKEDYRAKVDAWWEKGKSIINQGEWAS